MQPRVNGICGLKSDVIDDAHPTLVLLGSRTTAPRGGDGCVEQSYAAKVDTDYSHLMRKPLAVPVFLGSAVHAAFALVQKKVWLAP